MAESVPPRAPETGGDDDTRSAWERIQTRPVDSIEAEVFEQMAGRSDSDPLAQWADLALALCERIKTAETAAPPSPSSPPESAGGCPGCAHDPRGHGFGGCDKPGCPCALDHSNAAPPPAQETGGARINRERCRHEVDAGAYCHGCDDAGDYAPISPAPSEASGTGEGRSELDRCLLALALELPESVHTDVCRIVRAESARLQAEVERLTRWQVEVAEGIGYLNRAEGQSGYEVAEPPVIVAAWKQAEAERDALRGELGEEHDRLTAVRVACGAANDALRATEAKLARVEKVTCHLEAFSRSRSDDTTARKLVAKAYAATATDLRAALRSEQPTPNPEVKS